MSTNEHLLRGFTGVRIDARPESLVVVRRHDPHVQRFACDRVAMRRAVVRTPRHRNRLRSNENQVTPPWPGVISPPIAPIMSLRQLIILASANAPAAGQMSRHHCRGSINTVWPVPTTPATGRSHAEANDDGCGQHKTDHRGPCRRLVHRLTPAFHVRNCPPSPRSVHPHIRSE